MISSSSYNYNLVLTDPYDAKLYFTIGKTTFDVHGKDDKDYFPI